VAKLPSYNAWRFAAGLRKTMIGGFNNQQQSTFATEYRKTEQKIKIEQQNNYKALIPKIGILK
jgi:hypothetical protein